MTIGELRKRIADLPASQQLSISDTDGNLEMEIIGDEEDYDPDGHFILVVKIND